MKYKNENNYEKASIDAIYPLLGENARLVKQYLTNRIILSIKKEYVDNLNKKILNVFSRESNIYVSFMN